jgi:hypothetical protein
VIANIIVTNVISQDKDDIWRREIFARYEIEATDNEE